MLPIDELAGPISDRVALLQVATIEDHSSLLIVNHDEGADIEYQTKYIVELKCPPLHCDHPAENHCGLGRHTTKAVIISH